MAPRQPPPDEPEIPEPVVHDPAMEINIGEDILAAALAAVEKRMEKKPPSQEEMAEIEADIEVDMDAFDADEGGISDDSTPEAEAPGAPPNQDAISAEHAISAKQLQALQDELAETRLTARKLKLLGKKEMKERRRLTGVVQRMTEQLGQLRKEARNAVEAQLAAEGQTEQTRSMLEQNRQELTRIRHRQQRESDEQSTHGAQPVIQEFLPVLDNLELALAHTQASRDLMAEGLQMISSQFRSALNRLEVAPIEPAPGDAFEPRIHEAVEQAVSKEHAEGTVLQLQQRGYVRKGRLMRAARVIVSSGPGTEETLENSPEAAGSEPSDGSDT